MMVQQHFTIRIWHGCSVVTLLYVSDNGCTFSGPTGGAESSSNPDIEIDPWAGLIVDHTEDMLPPVAWRDQALS